MRDFLKTVGGDLAAKAARLPLVELGRQMNVVGGSAESPFPLNVGLLFFNSEPHGFFPATQIDVVWFPDGAGGDKFTEKIFRGPVPRMLRESLDYIRRNYISETVIKHHDRAEATRVENFPYPAIEEAVVNAIYHRGYDVREPVEVRISRDELVVVSYPGPDRSVRLKQLRAGKAISRRYRNRRIGEFLKELEFTEGRSTGIPKIMRAMKENGSLPAEFEFDEDHSYFMVRLPVQPEAALVALPADTAKLDSNGGQSPTQSPTQSGDPVERLLTVLQGTEKSSDELRKLLGIKHRPTFRENYLHPALRALLIEFTIPDKPNSRLQKYRLTQKGRTWLTPKHNTKRTR